MSRLRSLRRWWSPVLAVPAVLVTLPVIGFTPQGDEQLFFTAAAREFGSNPLTVARYAYDTIDLYLKAGNFRPLGRFVWRINHAFAFDAAEATGLSSHAVQDVLRLVLVAVLAMTSARVVAAVMRSAGVIGGRGALLVLYSLVLAVTLVASDPRGSLTSYPIFSLGSPLLILIVMLGVARDVDMQSRRLSWQEYPLMLSVGAVTAMFYDIVYLAPVLAAVFIFARAAASGQSMRHMSGTAAVRRWCVLAAGFSAVFVPTRVIVANLCERYVCYDASEIVLSGDVMGATAKRIASGIPNTGWAHTMALVEPTGGPIASYGGRVGIGGPTGNWLLVVLSVVVAVICVQAAGQLLRSPVGRGDESDHIIRMAAALGILGVCTGLLAALMVGSSKKAQRELTTVGQAWRESLVVQIGWSFMIFALIAVILTADRRWVRPARVVVVLTMLSVGAAGAFNILAVRILQSAQNEPVGISRALEDSPGLSLTVPDGRLFAVFAALAVALVLVLRWIQPTVVVVVVLALGMGVTGTLIANVRLGRIDRGAQTSMLVRQMSGAVVRVDLTEGGDTRRCGLIDAYDDLYYDPAEWQYATRLHEELDHFMLHSYNSLFCDRPGREEELNPEPWNTREWIPIPRE